MKKMGILGCVLALPMLGQGSTNTNSNVEAPIRNRFLELENPHLRTAITFARSGLLVEVEGENKDYWKTPSETDESSRGDCEDHAFYLDYLLDDVPNVKHRVAIGKLKGSESHVWHAWNEITVDGIEYIVDTINKGDNYMILKSDGPRAGYIFYDEWPDFAEELFKEYKTRLAQNDNRPLDILYAIDKIGNGSGGILESLERKKSFDGPPIMADSGPFLSRIRKIYD